MLSYCIGGGGGSSAPVADDAAARVRADLGWPAARLAQLDASMLALSLADQPHLRIRVLLCGLCALNVFVQANYTGPMQQGAPWSPFFAAAAPQLCADQFEQHTAFKALQKQAVSDLSVGGERVYDKVLLPHYLLLARRLLSLRHEDGAIAQYLPSYDLWTARYASVHQQVLSHAAAPLLDLAQKAFERLRRGGGGGALSHADVSDELLARVHLEEGLMYHHVQDNKRSKVCFRAAKEATGLHAELTGQMGVRTKYQVDKKAQLVVVARSRTATGGDTASSVGAASNDAKAPSEVLLDDESILLEKPKLDEDDNYSNDSNLRSIDQAILLSLCLDVKNNNPTHGLTTQEMLPYVQRSLDRSNNWMVHTMGLLLKTRIESEKSKTVERSVLQLQVLVEQYADAEPDVTHRMSYVYDLAFPPMFELKRELGLRFMSVGAVRSALEHFERLEMWEECIQCHISQDNMGKARALVEERIAAEPGNPLMWCLRGDISGNADDYEKAWQVSGQRFSRAKRSLGNHYFKKGDYAKCIENMELALELSPLYPMTWFVLGVSAIRTERWEVALDAFLRVVQQEPEDAEAWTNIASVYMYLKDYRKAFRALQEALRFKYDSWKMWENFLFCCMNLGEYSQAIGAATRIISIREEKELNTDVLFTLVRVLNTMRMRGETQSAEAMSQKLDQLFRTVTAKISMNPDVWDAYALYFEVLGNDDQRVEMRQKHVRTLQVSGWEREASKFRCVVLAAEMLVDAQLEAAEHVSGGEDADQKRRYIVSSAAMMLRSMMKRTEEAFAGTEHHDKLKALLARVDAAAPKESA